MFSPFGVRHVRLDVRQVVRHQVVDFKRMCGMCANFGLTHAGARRCARAPAQVRALARVSPARAAHGALARVCTRTRHPHMRRDNRTRTHRARARLFLSPIPEKGRMA